MSVLLARRGSSAIKFKSIPSDAPNITGFVNGTSSGSNINFASLPASSTSYVAIISAAGSVGTAPTAPTGWTLVSSGDNSNDSTWSRWWAFVGSSAAIAGTFTMAANEVRSGIILGYDAAITVTAPVVANQPNVNAVASTSQDSPSINLTSVGHVLRFVLFNSTSATAVVVTPPSSATLGRTTNTITNGTERMTISVASESRISGSTGVASWSMSGSGIYMPVLGSLHVIKT